MSKRGRQKQKLLYVAKFLLENTDEEHGVTMQEILNYLSLENIEADRKSVYDDLNVLTDFGMDISKVKTDKKVYYRILERNFAGVELKLLVDTVTAAKFLPARQSDELIEKIGTLTSKYEARDLKRSITYAGRVKSGDRKVYYGADIINKAMNLNQQITFIYTKWNLEKKKEPRNNGKPYVISPWALVWDDEYYYMIGYDQKQDLLKTFRVDKMQDVDIVEEKRQGEDVYQKSGMEDHFAAVFGMFGGEIALVSMIAKESLIGVFIDRFGQGIFVQPLNDGMIRIKVQAALTRRFYGWLAGFGNEVMIESPQQALEGMKALLEELADTYKIQVQTQDAH